MVGVLLLERLRNRIRLLLPGIHGFWWELRRPVTLSGRVEKKKEECGGRGLCCRSRTGLKTRGKSNGQLRSAPWIHVEDDDWELPCSSWWRVLPARRVFFFNEQCERSGRERR